jgi:Na+/proline symporter
MHILDYLIMLGYALGMLLIGAMLSRRNGNATAMFAAGRQSPWWLSGLSAYMSAFSAATFVVWGGIAYKSGMVAVSISMCLGVSSFLIGMLLAGRWQQSGISSAAEFARIRFGEAAVQFYTWTGMLFKLVAMGVAVYAFSTMVSALIPLPPGHPLASAATGKLSVEYTILAASLIMLVYTAAGGLWAVLVTDAVQFIVLMITVLFVVPAALQYAGGPAKFVAAVPETFFSPVNGTFTWLFLTGWVVVHFFRYGGEWIYIQRFLCVPTARDARWSSYLFGGLYLISPIIWMLPPMIYRAVDPAAAPEQAYILMCLRVLPAGMLGLMVAAMFSATASGVGGEINVFAGVLTRDFYQRWLRPGAGQRHLVAIGRLLTVILGVFLTGVALLVPYLGGAEKIVLTISGLVAAPMVIPMIWGLLSRKIGQSAIWLSTAPSLLLGAWLEFGLPGLTPNALSAWMMAHTQFMEVAIGTTVPLGVLLVLEMTTTREHPGYAQLQVLRQHAGERKATVASGFPARLMAGSLLVLALVMLVLGLVNQKAFGLLVGFAGVLFGIGMLVFWLSHRMEKKSAFNLRQQLH